MMHKLSEACELPVETRTDWQPVSLRVVEPPEPAAAPLPPVCSIIILTRNRASFLPFTLEAVLAHEGPTREVLVFDNGSTDETALIAQAFPVRYFSTPEYGLAEMRQRGLDQARGEFVIMCDDDCLPQPGWLENFVQRFRANPRLALLGGKIINVGFDSKIEKGIGRFGRNGQILLGGPPEQASYFGCANLAIRKSAVPDGGGFDPFLMSGYEEGDLAHTLLALGHRLEHAPDAAVEHHNISSTQRARWRWCHSGVMRLYFFLKHLRPRGLAWLGFVACECWLQGKFLIRGPASALPQRAFSVLATFLLLPYVLVASARARARLHLHCPGKNPFKAQPAS